METAEPQAAECTGFPAQSRQRPIERVTTRKRCTEVVNLLKAEPVIAVDFEGGMFGTQRAEKMRAKFGDAAVREYEDQLLGGVGGRIHLRIVN